MDTLPFKVLEHRLGRPIRKEKRLEVEYAPKFDACSTGKLDTLCIHEDYLHLQANKGNARLKKLCCCCEAAKQMETDDYFVLLKDTGFVEVTEHNNIASLVVQWCIMLTVVRTHAICRCL